MNLKNIEKKVGDLEIESDLSDSFVVNQDRQDVTGWKDFKDGIEIGDENYALGNICLAVGNCLTVGSYNFYYKGIEFDRENLSAKVYLTDKQLRYPYPFCILKGQNRKFKLQGNEVDLDDWSNTQKYLYYGEGNALSLNLSCAFYCINNVPGVGWHRLDYNQLCADLGENYWTNMNQVKTKITQYLADAMTPQKSLSVFHLDSNLANNEQITLINNDKITSHRCGTLMRVTDNGSVLEIKLNTSMGNYLSSNGIMFPDFDFDDYAVIFSDKPTLSGPANASTYSSIAVGIDNVCLRRCSVAAGKNNVSESDFAIALGRGARAKHYCSFVWSPNARYVDSPKNQTFTIGQNGRLANSIAPSSTNRTMYVADKYGGYDELHKFMLSCMANDPNLMKYLASKISSYIH